MNPYQEIIGGLWGEINRLQAEIARVHPLVLAAPLFFDAKAQDDHSATYVESAARLHDAFAHANAVLVQAEHRLALLLDDAPAGVPVQ